MYFFLDFSFVLQGVCLVFFIIDIEWSEVMFVLLMLHLLINLQSAGRPGSTTIKARETETLHPTVGGICWGYV